MFAIVCKADGFPVSRQDLVVTWVSQAAATSFLSAKGLETDYQVVALTDDSLGKMAQALGCPVEAIAFDAYPA